MNGKKISAPICDFLHSYARSDTARFHMPGHKGRIAGNEHQAAGVDNAPSCETNGGFIEYSHDITEIYGADSLYEAGGIIAESEKNASALFGSRDTFYSTEGSSQCIKAMLALVSRYGRWSDTDTDTDTGTGTDADADADAGIYTDTGERPMKRPVILAARNVHKAFVSACALLDLDVKWILPESPEYSICQCRISAESIRKAILSMSEKPCAVYITSPDYTGNIQDIYSIAQAAHEFGIPLLVDNAHGAYLHFLEKPLHPLDLGADMCCDSAHKTLPALTGCAYLHISSSAPEEYTRYARQALCMFGSTSPSYLLLESLDRTNQILSGNFRSQLKNTVSRTLQCCNELSKMGWQLSEHPMDENIFREPLKITIYTANSGYTGTLLASILRNNKIECEYCDPDLLVLMPSVNTTDTDFERLISCMRSIPLAQNPASEYVIDLRIPYPHQAISIRQAAFSPAINLPVEKCEGCICADMMLSCPPAIPIAVCGETITREMISILEHYGIKTINVCHSK